MVSIIGILGSILCLVIVNVVLVIFYLCDILYFLVMKVLKDLYEYVVDVFKYLVFDKYLWEVIGSIGGVILNLMLLFIRRLLYYMLFL